MLEICRFYGIIIQFFYNDHTPAHFHATYGEFEALISIADLTVLEGKLSKRALELTIDWAELHKDELMKEWELCRLQQPLFKIQPLD